MRSPHQLHGVLDVAPLFGFFGVALVLASLGILGRLDNSLEAVLLEHLTRDHVNLYLGYHVALLMFHHARNGRNRCLSAARSTCRSAGSLDLLVAHAILRLSIKKEESGLRDFFVGEWGNNAFAANARPGPTRMTLSADAPEFKAH